MTVPFHEYIAKASALLSRAGGESSFGNVLEVVVPTLDTSRVADRWEHEEIVTPLTIGQVINYHFPRVPNDEEHVYHYIALDLGESGNKMVLIDIDTPTAPSDLTFNVVRIAYDLAFSLNLLGTLELTGLQEVFHNRPLVVPSRMQLRVRTESGLVGAGPTNIILGYIRQIIMPAFETRVSTSSPVVTVT